MLECTPEALAAAAARAAKNGATFRRPGRRTTPEAALDALLGRLGPMFFDPAFEPMVTHKTPEGGKDILQASANNLYAGVTMADLEGFAERYGLNSRLVKRDGKLVEEAYRIDGRYDEQIAPSSATWRRRRPSRRRPCRGAGRLVKWYRTGDDEDRKAYDIAWVRDKTSPVDTINGFIEVYMDPRGVKGSWESAVFYVNQEKTKDIESWPPTRNGSRTTCRGPRSSASRT